MLKDDNGKQFIEQVDRLLAGEAVESGAHDADYQNTIDFARRLAALRDEPRPVFASSLKARLLGKLVEMESRESAATARIAWWRRPVWGAVIAVVVTAVSLGVMWRLGVFTPLPGTAPATPTVPATPAEPSAPILPSAPSDTTPTAPMELTTPAFDLVEISAGPQQESYAKGAAVEIALTVSNFSPETISLSPFPPEIAVTTPEMATVWELSGGSEELTVEAGDTETYYFTWNQRDQTNNAVASGEYTIVFNTYIRRDDLVQPATVRTEFVIH